MIRLSMPPSVNQMYRNVPGRGRVKTKSYTAWLTEAGYTLLSQRPQKFSGDVLVNIQIGPRDKRADCDNRIKAILDLLTKMRMIADDRFVVSVLCAWNDNVRGAEVEVRAA
jgi:Holliday junction resolvase RusA-like endonuclease